MKRVIITIIGVFVFCTALFAQSSIDKGLLEIEKNNTTLSALRKLTDANKIGNKTGIYLQNPEFEFNYLWGNSSAIGNRTDVRVVQTFDFPSAYKFKNQISDNKNQQADLEYQKQKKELLLQARIICNELIFQNAIKTEQEKRLINAESISKSYLLKFEQGEANILERNKAEINVLNAQKELQSNEIKRNYLLSELARYNGDIPIEFTDENFQPSNLPVDFEQWYLEAEQKNPILSWLKHEIDISANQEKLNRAMSLPKLQTGYMSEKTVFDHFQGVTLGLSIPLWENKNTVKFAEAQSLALQSVISDNKLQFYNRLKSLHSKATALAGNIFDYRQKLEKLNSTELLKKALDGGEINLIEYMLEVSIYYDSVVKMLEMEKYLNDTLTELNQFM